MATATAPQLLRFATAGSVDDGKSTLIGRLLYDSKSLLADQMAEAEGDLARLTDGLRAEREQGINKMDLVGYDADRFRTICADFRAWAGRLAVEEITCIPISALRGDNVVEHSEAMDWYRGPTLLEFLEAAPVAAGPATAPLRLPVQYVIRAGEQRGYAGQLAGGTVRVGDDVVVLPSGLSSRVSAIEGPGGPLEEASAPLSVAVSLEDELDVGRGALICPSTERPVVARELEATICWLGESPGRAGGRYLLKHTTRSERVKLDGVREILDVATLTPKPGGDSLGLNDIARVSLRCASELAFDPYSENRWTGAFILIDSATNDTVGAGMIR